MSDDERVLYFFFNDTATTEIYTLSLHDALPISTNQLSTPLSGLGPLGSRPRGSSTSPTTGRRGAWKGTSGSSGRFEVSPLSTLDRKSTRLNSSHANISYAVFCLKKKTIILYPTS